MSSSDPSDRVLDAARGSGLIRSGEPLLVLLSGGADSVCLLDVALQLGARVAALHVDHGIRPESEEDAQLCRELCEVRGVELSVERIELRSASGPGNLQAEARERRYELAKRHASGDYATGHLLRAEAEVLQRATGEALRQVGGPPLSVAALRELPPALARLILRRTAEDAAGDEGVALPRRDIDRILGASSQGSSVVELSGGLCAVVEYGWVRFDTARPEGAPEPVPLTIPGSVSFGPWRLEAHTC